MSESLKLGQIIEPGREVHRDAIHVAVAPVVAAHRLQPGDHVGLDESGAAQLTRASIGIVDPFLTIDVQKGQRFWLYLYPGSITSLRHEWTHPAFTVVMDREASEQWLRKYAAEQNSYDTPEAAFSRLIEGLMTGQLFFHGSDLHGLHDLDDADELKRHAERYLGISIDWQRFSFSCSC